MDFCGNLNRIVATRMYRNVSGTGCDLEIHRAGYFQGSIEMSSYCGTCRQQSDSKNYVNSQRSDWLHSLPTGGNCGYCRTTCCSSFNPDSSSVFEPLEMPTVTAIFFFPSLPDGSGISTAALRSLS